MLRTSSCLVGCGRMGQRHASALQELDLEILAVIDPVLVAAVALIGGLKGVQSPKTYSSLSEFLADQVPEIVVVATTADSHSSIALEAIDAGVRLLLLEKPLSTSLLDCQQLVKACQRTGACIAVNHQMRFLPQYQLPKELLTSEAYGGFHSMHVAAGNFGMAMNGTHYFEAFRFLVDEAPTEVSAWFDKAILPNPRGSQFQDVSGCIRVITASGKRLYIDASADQGHGAQVTYMARNGRITVDELTGAVTTVVRSAEHREAPTSRYGMPVEIEQHQIPPVELVESTKAVLQALLAGEGYPTLTDATLAVKTLVAAYHSHRQGGVPVRLEDIADDDPEVFPWA